MLLRAFIKVCHLPFQGSMATLIVGTFDFYRSAGVARDSCSQRPTKTLHVSCENVPAVGHLGALLAAAGDNIFSDLFSPFLLFELLSKCKFLTPFSIKGQRVMLNSSVLRTLSPFCSLSQVQIPCKGLLAVAKVKFHAKVYLQ